MKSAISADESAKPDYSRTVLFVPDTPLVSELWASGVRHYLEILPKYMYPKRRSYVQGDTKPIFTPNVRTMSADSKRMLAVPDTLPELGVIVA